MSEKVNDIDRLLLDFLDGNSNPDELRLLKDWAGQDNENLQQLKHLNDIYLAASVLSPRSGFDSYKPWSGLRQRCLNPPEKEFNNFGLRQILKIAAILFICFIMGVLAYRYLTVKEKTASTYSEYNVPRGSRSHLFLPDGTSVWLNAQSSLRYNQDFGKKTREVLLQGEAYFEVVRSETLPFVVRASKTVVKVLGTAFNVKAYPDEHFIETTVVQGKVQVLSPEIKTPGQEITLIANQKIKILTDASGKEKETSPIKTEHNNLNLGKISPAELQVVDFSPDVSAKVYSSWKDSLWIIERETLKELAIKIARRYNVDVRFRDTELEDYIFSGKLRDESLQQVLQAISTAAPVGFDIHQKSVTFCKKTKNND